MAEQGGWPLYVSYSWREEEQSRAVDRLQEQCADSRLELYRDTGLVKPGDYFRQLAEVIGSSARCLVVLSESYLLHSRWCLIELDLLARLGRANDTWWVCEANRFSLEIFLDDPAQRRALESRCLELNTRHADTDKELKTLDSEVLLAALGRFRSSMPRVEAEEVDESMSWQPVLRHIEQYLPPGVEPHDDCSELRKDGLLKLAQLLNNLLDDPLLVAFSPYLKSQLDDLDLENLPGEAVGDISPGGRLCRTDPEALYECLAGALSPAVEEYVEEIKPSKDALHKLRDFVLCSYFSVVRYRWLEDNTELLTKGRFIELRVDVDEPALVRLLTAAPRGNAPALRLENKKGALVLTDHSAAVTSGLRTGDFRKDVLSLLESLCTALNVKEQQPDKWEPEAFRQPNNQWRKLLGNINGRLKARNRRRAAVMLHLRSGRFDTEFGALREFLPDLRAVIICGSEGSNTLLFDASSVHGSLLETLGPIAERLDVLEGTTE